MLDDFLKDASSEGTFESRGAFTVEMRRARAKLGSDFAKAFPHCYPFKFIQAAVMMGASSVKIECHRKSLSVEWSPEPGTELTACLQESLTQGESSPTNSASYSLLLGVWAALSEGGSQIVIESQEEGRKSCYRVSSESLEFVQSEIGAEVVSRIRMECFRPASARKVEMSVLNSRLGYSRAEIFLNGRLLSSPWAREGPASEDPWYSPLFRQGFRLAESFWEDPGSTTSGLNLPPGEARDYRYVGDTNQGNPKWQGLPNNCLCQPRPNQVGPYSAAFAIPIDLKGKTKLIPVCQGVRLNPIEVDLAFPGGIVVLDCLSLGLKVDVFGLSVIKTPGFTKLQAKLRKELKNLLRYSLKWEDKLVPEGFFASPEAKVEGGGGAGLALVAGGLAFNPLVSGFGLVYFGRMGYRLVRSINAGISLKANIRARCQGIKVSRETWGYFRGV